MSNSIKEYLHDQIHMVNRSIVATPETRADLDAFSNANYGSNDMLLTQMAVNYGYKIALENILELLNKTSNS